MPYLDAGTVPCPTFAARNYSELDGSLLNNHKPNIQMKKYLKYLSPIGLDLLLTIIGLMIIGSDQSISIIIIFFFMLATAISLVVAIVLFCKKKWVFGTLWVVNMLLAPVVMMGACKLCYSTTHALENRSFVCYDVQATRWKTNFHNFELELKRHSSKCTICSFDERYVGGGYSGSSDWHHGTYSTNPDGSYQIIVESDYQIVSGADTLLLRNDTLYGLADYGVPMEEM